MQFSDVTKLADSKWLRETTPSKRGQAWGSDESSQFEWMALMEDP